MKYAPVIAVLALLWLAVFWIFTTDHPPDALGYPHVRAELAQPEGATKTMMFQGGIGRDRHIQVSLAGIFFGIVTLTGFSLLIAWGCRSRHASQEIAAFFWNLMVMVAIVLVGAFLTMCTVYQSSWDHPFEPHYLGPFPFGTTLMFLGICGVPVGFIVLYVLFYREFILPTRSLARFNELVAARESAAEKDDVIA